MTLIGYDSWVRAIAFHSWWEVSSFAPEVAKDIGNGIPQRLEGSEKPQSKISKRGQPGIQPRCVLATGSADHKIQVFG
ncbi:uncharacterized protein N7500_006724 [Penicillium coprophilum]|uniref:uncharacterized protein n=1 Tax=Penicillium coprophilum TaxID=36646 RepID=UPI00239FC2B1|nr:uncharacterized protein N7500_006724 [Penicillium coprophilum]KAJ5164894.1 hypothetical protein N7500_006724 [Penicillium coprophilum]